jgi:two-component system, chemotaxis family, sensor kinase CheA
MADNEALLKELLDTFRLEAQDHLGALSTLLVSLENEAAAVERRRLVESIFRRMHTLKGAAHAVNLVDVAKVCQELEDLLAGLKRGELELGAELFDRLHHDIDALALRLGDGAEGTSVIDSATALPPDSAAPLSEISVHLAVAAVPEVPVPSPAPAPEPPPASAVKAHAGETVRVSTRLLEALLLQGEELVSAKLTASALAEELAAARAELEGRGYLSGGQDLAREALRQAQPGSPTTQLASLLQQNCRDQLATGGRLRSLESKAQQHVRTLAGMVDPLLDDLKKLHLLPFSSLTDPLPKLVRDLGRELGKEAELTCSGCQLEVDRRILAGLKEPLLHLVRNVMDHGIETPAERRAQGKPLRGRISIEARLQDANLAEVLVRDDGRGIDLAKVKGAALRSELATMEALEAMPDAEALQLVFESGISTTPLITTLSGRGVGLAIVRESVEKLGGQVRVSSTPGAGTLFRLTLPLSYAMMRALLVESCGRTAFLPAANVELATRVPRGEIRTVENRETVVLGGEVVSVARLAQLLDLNEARTDDNELQPLVLAAAGEKKVAFAVDQVLEVVEILVKPLGPQLQRVKNVSGATVLGNGRVVPVLNIGDLFRSATVGASPLAAAAPAPKQKRLTVLVAEDSITSRTLLKNILDASGFLVQTAIDGADALSQLKTGEFDVVVSDVEMPRMDGFQLTEAIRAEQRLAELPVILVTGLESRADRERGIDVGANAYVVKSSFDQGALIEVIHKLA